MVLRYDRRSSPADAPGPAARTARGFTAADVGRTLSRERKRQGLSLQDVSMRTGIPVGQLRGAETGLLDRPDGLATLKTVRRYADLLGLPGDRFALAILEQWPTRGGSPSPFGAPAAASTIGGGRFQPPTILQGTGPTAAVPATSGPAPAGAGGAGGKGHATTRPPRNGAIDTGPTTELVEAVPWTGYGAGTANFYDTSYSDTGVTPAVRTTDDQIWRRQRRGVPAALRALVVVITLAVLAGVTLLAIDRLHPSWLRAVGLSGKLPAAAAAPAPNGAERRPVTASTATLRAQRSASGTVFDVRASKFSVKLSATSGPCWVEVTSPTVPAPLYTGIVQPGSPKTMSESHAVVVEFGATTGRVSVTSAAGHVATYVPLTVPYKVTIQTTR